MSTEQNEDGTKTPATPSAEFINAISQFFDTDPSDLLTELGYYQREDTIVSLAEMSAQQE